MYRSRIRGDNAAGLVPTVLTLLAFFYQRRAALVVPIGDLALQAVMAFVVDDLTRGLDRGDLALVTAGLAGRAALIATAQPVKNTEF